MRVTRATALSVWHAQVDGDARVRDSNVSEIRAVLLHSWRAHAHRIQVDAGRIRYGAAYTTLPRAARQGLPSPVSLVSGRSVADTQVRALMQLTF